MKIYNRLNSRKKYSRRTKNRRIITKKIRRSLAMKKKRSRTYRRRSNRRRTYSGMSNRRRIYRRRNLKGGAKAPAAMDVFESELEDAPEPEEGEKKDGYKWDEDGFLIAPAPHRGSGIQTAAQQLEKVKKDKTQLEGFVEELQQEADRLGEQALNASAETATYAKQLEKVKKDKKELEVEHAKQLEKKSTALQKAEAQLAAKDDELRLAMEFASESTDEPDASVLSEAGVQESQAALDARWRSEVQKLQAALDAQTEDHQRARAQIEGNKGLLKEIVQLAGELITE